MKGLQALKRWASSYSSCVIAFSGGVDSTFLLYALKTHTDLHIRAVTLAPPYVPRWELEEAGRIAGEMGIEHLVIELPIADELQDNPEDRCYRCKHILFERIIERSDQWHADVVVDGTNADDARAYRPGMKALQELGIRSPLLECGFTKEDIRKLCRDWGLSVADKPAYSCLMTRIPHGTRVTEELLRTIETAERYLHACGFPDVRVRVHRDIARIEIGGDQFQRFCSSRRLQDIDQYLKRLGFSYVTVDLSGYTSGSMDPTHHRG